MSEERDIQVAPAGLMRCCTGTIGEKHEDGSLAKVERLTGFKCHYCSSWMWMDEDDVVKWWRDHPGSYQPVGAVT